MFRPVITLLCTGVALACVPAIQAEESFRAEVADAANRLTAVMKAIHAQTITPLGVEDRTTYGATVLPGLEQMLSEELKKAGAIVRKAGGSVGVKLVLSAPREPPYREGEEPGPRFLRLAFQLFDEGGEAVKTLNMELPAPASSRQDIEQPSPIKVVGGKIEQDIKDDSSALAAFGANVDLNAGILDPFDALRDSLDQPTVSIGRDGATARPSSDSPFGLRIMSNGRPKRLRLIDGQPFVDLRAGEKFTLELENRARFDANATVTLDGVNSFRFSRLRKSDGNSKYTSWNLAKGKTFSIAGWHLDNSTAQEFVATTYDQSKLRELGLAETPVGAVTVVFRSAWELPKLAKGEQAIIEKPPGEDTYLRRIEVDGEIVYAATVAVRQDIYVGGGDEVGQQVSEGPKRQIGRVRGVVTIRYRHPLAND